MARIIVDSYTKGEKQIWGDDPREEFNQKILAVNNMYGWLYEKGILEKVAFEMKDYADMSYFAFNARDLEPYRANMETSGITGAALAVRHIFDEDYTPCLYSGAIELGWTMMSYRDVDGCVGRSWECSLIKSLGTDGIYEVSNIRDSDGVAAAVKHMFSMFDWDLTLPEQKKYQVALEYYSREAGTDIENDYTKAHGRELIFCHENGKSLLDFDFWTCYETLCGEKFSYDAYIAIDNSYEGDPLEIQEGDEKTISALKSALKAYLDPKNHQKASGKLDNQIQSAASRNQREQGVVSHDPKAKGTDPVR